MFYSHGFFLLFLDYENYDYYDDDIFDSYPTDPSMSSDPEFTHPELENIPFFTGKIPFPPTTQEPIRVQSVDDNLVVHKSDKTQMEIEEANWKKNQNEVFPKDAPYTQSASKTVNSVSFCVLLSIIWLQLANWLVCMCCAIVIIPERGWSLSIKNKSIRTHSVISS